MEIPFYLFGPDSHLHYGDFLPFWKYRSFEAHINEWLLHPLYSCFVLEDDIKKSKYKVESGYYLQGLSFSKKEK